MQCDLDLQRSEIALIGRVYVISDEQWYYPHFFPVDAMVALKLQFEEVVPHTLERMSPPRSEGAYFFGVKFGAVPLHFVMCYARGVPDTHEVHLVTGSGWHQLDHKGWRSKMMPLVADMLMTSRTMSEPEEISYATAKLAKIMMQSGETDADDWRESFMAIVSCFGAHLVLEQDELLTAAAEALDMKLLEGQTTERVLTKEITELRNQMHELRQQNQALVRGASDPGPTPCTQTPNPADQTDFAPSLEQRMSRLILQS